VVYYLFSFSFSSSAEASLLQLDGPQLPYLNIWFWGDFALLCLAAYLSVTHLRANEESNLGKQSSKGAGKESISGAIGDVAKAPQVVMMRWVKGCLLYLR